jgi:hypothetical protein
MLCSRLSPSTCLSDVASYGAKDRTLGRGTTTPETSWLIAPPHHVLSRRRPAHRLDEHADRQGDREGEQQSRPRAIFEGVAP